MAPLAEGVVFRPQDEGAGFAVIEVAGVALTAVEGRVEALRHRNVGAQVVTFAAGIGAGG